MSNKINSKFEEVAAAIKILESITEPGKDVEFDEYRKARIRMNIPALEIIFGATIDGNKVKFDQPLPNMKELNKLFDMIDKYSKSTESIIMAQFNAAAADVNSSVVISSYDEELPHINKITVRNVSAAITGGNGQVQFPMISMIFTPSQIIEMSAMAMELRKVIMRNRALIIGGVALGATAATVAGICIYNNSKKKKDTDIEESNSGDDIPLVDMGDDIPLVDMGDDIPLVDM